MKRCINGNKHLNVGNPRDDRPMRELSPRSSGTAGGTLERKVRAYLPSRRKAKENEKMIREELFKSAVGKSVRELCY
jgi:hypothetical protein